MSLPNAWHLIGYSMLAALIASSIFLAAASYARAETVTGTIVLDRGVAPVVSTRPGIVLSIDVREGQHVRAGAALAHISAEENMSAGGSAAAKVLSNLARQDALLQETGMATVRAARADKARLLAQLAGSRDELRNLDDQVSFQKQFIADAEKEVSLVSEVAAKGFISRHDMMLREEAVLSRKQQLAQLLQAKASKQQEIRATEKSIEQAVAQADVQSTQLETSRAELQQQRIGAAANRGYALVAPRSGTVTAVVAKPGEAVSAQRALMMLVPDGASALAEVYVPSQAIGFLKVGQEVHLAVDAYPYQKYGMIPGVVENISMSAIPHADAAGATTSSYLVSIRPRRSWVVADGEERLLRPGMSLTARIITGRESLWRSLFRPAFGLTRR